MLSKSFKLIRLVRRLFFRWFFGKIFFQARMDKKGNIASPKKIITNLNQCLIEKGYNLPWIWTKEECRSFWVSKKNEDKQDGNRPECYAKKPSGIVDFLCDFIGSEVKPENSILELGCNCGVNLNGLYNRGYGKLSGIEINENAVKSMKDFFPELAENAKILTGSLEDVLPKIASKSFDMVFTMAVLIHVHPTSNFIFQEITRIARKYICVIEVETANCAYVFIRNYRRVFEKLGYSQLKSVLITQESFPNVPRGYDGYVARLFSA